MSQKHYIQKWDRTETDLRRILSVERPKKPAPLEVERKSAFNMIALLYVKYVRIYQRLQKCYDYMLHPQKRILISRCLEGVTGRCVELRYELIRTNIDEYANLNDMCHDLKLTPGDLTMVLSKVMALERVTKVRRQTQLLEYIQSQMGTGVDDDDAHEEDVYTVAEAVVLIQRNQRCFHARLKKKQLRLLRKGKGNQKGHFVPLELVNEKAVISFQGMWRGYKIRQKFHDLRILMDKFLDMLPGEEGINIRMIEDSVVSQAFKDAKLNEDSLTTDTIVTQEKMLDEKGAAMGQDMKTVITQWILECRSITGAFPEYPDEEEGGSAMLFSKKTVKEVEDDMDELQEMILKNAKPKKEKKKEEKKKEKKGKNTKNEGYIMKKSNFIDSPMVECAQEYGEFWWHKDETDNRKQTYDINLMMDDVRANVEEIVRLQVDELMRQELDRLKCAVDHQKAGNAKKKKSKKDAKKKGKKKKKKGLKDLTAGVPMEELYKELVLEGIIKKIPNLPLSDFIGDYNMISESDCETVEDVPDLGDARRMVFDFGILPMSSAQVHQNSPFNKSLFLVGPHGSGKKMLVYAMCYELGATLFDLSPENLMDKYEGKRGQKLLMHLVMKVGKEMEPAVIFVGGCDRMFTKKLPAEVAELKPARMKADLTKAMKFVTADDRILLVGTSKYPFKAKQGPMWKMFNRMVFIHPPSHSSRVMLWQKLIKQYKGEVSRDFDLFSLAKVTQGFTAGAIKDAAAEVLTPNRVKKLNLHPLKTVEFVNRIAIADPVYRDELLAFQHWLLTTPLAKRKMFLVKQENEGVDISGML